MTDEDENSYNNDNLNNNFINNNKKYDKLNKTLIIFMVIVIINSILIGLVTYVIIKIFEKDDKEKETLLLTTLKYDKEFIKPNIKMNLEFELVKLKNNMTGLIINDPYSSSMLVQFEVQNGKLTDTIGGISHLAEHMLFGGSEKYKYYSFERIMEGIKDFYSNSHTGYLNQAYYISIFNNYKYQKAIDILLDALRHPLYDKEIIEKEIQAINSEFYLGYREFFFLIDDIIRQFSSTKTSFNGFGCGNNETLNPKLSRILKQYHMVVNKPENIFFVFYSNFTINESKEYIKNNFNYKMYEFPENEIDQEYKKEFEKNIINLKTTEIFDDNLYKHGIFFNSNINQNILNIFFHIGNFDYKVSQFDIIEYYDYLFYSVSLIKKLKEKELVVETDRLGVYTHLLLENNNVLNLELWLTDNGLNKLDEVLIIIYNYIDILKEEGFKKKYFDNFIKYRENQNIMKFRRSEFSYRLNERIDLIIQNYRLYGEDQIFTTGTPNENNYNENKLKNCLHNLTYEKSFFLLNTDLNLESIKPKFLENLTIKTIKYYKEDILIGKFSKNFENRIKKEKIENLSMREINPYAVETKGKITPCYKQFPNKCKELNEFDFGKEEKYSPTVLKENDNFITYYQIDKSSESFLVRLYIEFNVQENELLYDRILRRIESNYLETIILEIDEMNSVEIANFDSTSLGFEFICFKDNIVNIFRDFIKIIKREPQEAYFNYIVKSIESLINLQKLSLYTYTNYIIDFFIEKGEIYDMYNEEYLEMLNNATFEDLKNYHNLFFNNESSILLKIAGNINKSIVQNLNSIIKENMQITPQKIKIFKDLEIKDELPFVINYYQKSNLSYEIDNAITIMYKYDEKYEKYMDILLECLNNIAYIYLRFNYSNSYSPSIFTGQYLVIYEQGRYKEVTQMEEDINEVLLGMLNGTFQCENYKDIVESYKIKSKRKKEKTFDSLVNNFFYEEEELKTNFEEEKKMPDNFIGLMKELSPIFTYPQRYAVLLGRSDLSDEDFEKIVQNNMKKKEYIFNSSIIVEHTEDFYYMKNRSQY